VHEGETWLGDREEKCRVIVPPSNHFLFSIVCCGITPNKNEGAVALEKLKAFPYNSKV